MLQVLVLMCRNRKALPSMKFELIPKVKEQICTFREHYLPWSDQDQCLPPVVARVDELVMNGCSVHGS